MRKVAHSLLFTKLCTPPFAYVVVSMNFWTNIMEPVSKLRRNPIREPVSKFKPYVFQLCASFRTPILQCVLRPRLSSYLVCFPPFFCHTFEKRTRIIFFKLVIFFQKELVKFLPKNVFFPKNSQLFSSKNDNLSPNQINSD